MEDRRWQHLKVLLTAAAIMVVGFAPRALQAQGLTLTGYADFEGWVNNIGSENKDFFFDNHHLNLIMVAAISENMFAAGEIEYEHAGEEIAVEYAYFGYTGIENVRILAGKFIVPFGRFNKDLHPTTVNKVPGRPHGFKDILPQTYNDVGIWVSGAAPFNDDSKFVYDVFAVNGLTGGEGDGIRGLRDNDREKAAFGRDDDKALGARLGLEFPYSGFDIGGSVYTTKYAENVTGNGLRLTLLGADASYQRNGLALRGEVVTAKQAVDGANMTKTGGYLQASYMVNSGFEPVARWSARSMPGTKDDLGRLALGFSSYLTPASAVRVAYVLNSEQDGFKKDNNTFVVQFSVIL